MPLGALGWRLIVVRVVCYRWLSVCGVGDVTVASAAEWFAGCCNYSTYFVPMSVLCGTSYPCQFYVALPWKYGTELLETNYLVPRGPGYTDGAIWLATRWSRKRNLIETGAGNSNKIAVENANLCVKYPLSALCWNMWKMRQLYIRVKLTCLTSVVCESAFPVNVCPSTWLIGRSCSCLTVRHQCIDCILLIAVLVALTVLKLMKSFVSSWHWVQLAV